MGYWHKPELVPLYEDVQLNNKPEAAGLTMHMPYKKLGCRAGLFGMCRVGLCFAALLQCLCGCTPDTPPPEEGGSEQMSTNASLTVFVSIVPQKAFVHKIAGERAAVHVMVRPGHSPATYEPLPRQLTLLSAADIYFRIGVPFEDAWLPRLRSVTADMPVVDTRKGIDLRHMHAHHGHTHGEGMGAAETEADHAAHSERNRDPHIWLDPILVKTQAETMTDGLAAVDPDHADFYRERLVAFQRELDGLDHQIRTLLSGLENRAFMVFHPSWGYFAERYGLEQIPVEIEGKEPSARELEELIRLAESQGIKRIFVQQQFSSKSAQAIADAVGATVVSLDPLAPNYMENMLDIARTIAEAEAGE